MKPNCDCVNEAKKGVLEYNTEIEEVSLPVNLMTGCFYLPIQIRKKGRKGFKEIPLELERCPICGKEYTEETI